MPNFWWPSILLCCLQRAYERDMEWQTFGERKWRTDLFYCFTLHPTSQCLPSKWKQMFSHTTNNLFVKLWKRVRMMTQVLKGTHVTSSHGQRCMIRKKAEEIWVDFFFGEIKQSCAYFTINGSQSSIKTNLPCHHSVHFSAFMHLHRKHHLNGKLCLLQSSLQSHLIIHGPYMVNSYSQQHNSLMWIYYSRW